MALELVKIIKSRNQAGLLVFWTMDIKVVGMLNRFAVKFFNPAQII
jgi:hypothetical protein